VKRMSSGGRSQKARGWVLEVMRAMASTPATTEAGQWHRPEGANKKAAVSTLGASAFVGEGGG